MIDLPEGISFAVRKCDFACVAIASSKLRVKNFGREEGESGPQLFER